MDRDQAVSLENIEISFKGEVAQQTNCEVVELSFKKAAYEDAGVSLKLEEQVENKSEVRKIDQFINPLIAEC